MGQIHSITKLTDKRFLNLYHVKATSVHDTPVNYFVASRAKDVADMQKRHEKNIPDGVIIPDWWRKTKSITKLPSGR